MPRKYQRTSNKCSWTTDQLKSAMDYVRTEETSIRNAAKLFKIPYTTLQNRFVNNNTEIPKLGAKPVLTKANEDKIAAHLIGASRLFYGMTKLQLRKAVYNYATTNNIRNPFNSVNKLAGPDWLQGFLTRNPMISVRKPEATSINRISAFTKVNVGVFYDNLQTVMDQYHFEADRIFNVDETGINIVHKPSMILAEKGTKQVGAATSAERGKNHTVCCGVSATGVYVPPMFIFPRKRMAAKLMIDGPPGALYTVSKSGWMTEELFVDYLHHFAKKVNASRENRILLIMDNHSSHCTIEVYNFCIENGIVIVTLPPHTSHKMQPLDLTIFGPLKTAFKLECEALLQKHHFQKLVPEQLASLFNRAWIKICSTEKAINGFKAAGIYPLNRNIFSDEDYYWPEGEAVVQLLNDASLNRNTDSNEQSNECDNSNISSNQFVEIEPMEVLSDDILKKIDFSVNIEFAQISPLPVAPAQKTNKRKQKSEILTSSPQKVILENKRKRKTEREEKKSASKPTQIAPEGPTNVSKTAKRGAKQTQTQAVFVDNVQQGTSHPKVLTKSLKKIVIGKAAKIKTCRGITNGGNKKANQTEPKEKIVCRGKKSVKTELKAKEVVFVGKETSGKNHELCSKLLENSKDPFEEFQQLYFTNKMCSACGQIVKVGDFYNCKICEGCFHTVCSSQRSFSDELCDTCFTVE